MKLCIGLVEHDVPDELAETDVQLQLGPAGKGTVGDRSAPHAGTCSAYIVIIEDELHTVTAE